MFFVLKSIFAQTVCTTSTSQPAFAFKRFKRENVMMQSESPYKSESSNKIQLYVENSSTIISVAKYMAQPYVAKYP